jgi:hypothetical protein
VLGEVADADIGCELELAGSGLQFADQQLDEVDLPAPLGPSSAMRAPARSTRLIFLNSDFSP